MHTYDFPQYAHPLIIMDTQRYGIIITISYSAALVVTNVTVLERLY